MPSRFSPLGYVPNRSADLLSDAITGALDAYQGGKQRQKIQTQADADRTREQTIQNIGLAKEGIHLLPPGEQVPTRNPNASIAQSLATGVAQTPLTVGQGYYIDNEERAANAKREADARFAAILSDALAKGKAEDVVNPGGRALKSALVQSEINRNNRPAPPAIGSPEWLAAQAALENLRTGAYQTRRLFAVAHPMPTRNSNGEPAQVVSTRKDLAATEHQQVRAETREKSLKSERRQLLNDHPRANKALSDQRTAADSLLARQYQGLGAQIDSAQSRTGRLTQSADSIRNVLSAQRAHGPSVPDDDITDEEIQDALSAGVSPTEDAVRAHVTARRGLP